jgi:hypothetical protein
MRCRAKQISIEPYKQIVMKSDDIVIQNDITYSVDGTIIPTVSIESETETATVDGVVILKGEATLTSGSNAQEIVLDNGGIFTWPEDVLDYSVIVSVASKEADEDQTDNVWTRYSECPILERTASTLRCVNSTSIPNLSPSSPQFFRCKWEIIGILKKQDLEIKAISYDYSNMDEAGGMPDESRDKSNE